MTVGELKAWLEFQHDDTDVVLECVGHEMLRDIVEVSNRLRHTIRVGEAKEMFKGSPYKRGQPGNDFACVLIYHL